MTTTPETLRESSQPAPGWIPNPDTFGARLALVRQRMGWNIAEAARECGLSGESWRLWEQGRIPARQAQIAMAISRRTGADLYWLAFDPLPRPVTRGYPHLISEVPVQRVAATPVPDLAARHMTLLPGGPLAVSHPTGGWRPTRPPSPRRTAPTGM